MTEKRQHKRYKCNIKVDFEYYENSPENVNPEKDTIEKSHKSGKGRMLDISMGGTFLVSNSRLAINLPVKLHFKIKKQVYDYDGIIIRTGLLKNNPSEIAQKFSKVAVKEDAYIAIKFNEILNNL